MSTSRYINRICIAATAISLALALLFMNGASLGIASADAEPGYASRLFDTSRVHELSIMMDDWDGFLETCENEEYSPCAVVIDGESYKNVGIRAKGNTSLSSVRSLGSQRYSFKLEFDQYEAGKTYHGLDKLSLNNLIQDNTMMKDYLAYRMMADFGADAPLCSYVFLTVNGEDWGLYLAVESVEDSFLKRNYGTESGSLYKPDSLSFGGGRGNGRDFDFGDFDFDSMDSWNRPERPSGFTGGGPEAGAGTQSGMPDFPGGGAFPDSGFPETPSQSFPGMPDGFPGGFPSRSDEASEGVSGGDADTDVSSPQGGPGGFGGFGGMGSDDVKLKYTDDDPDSYRNIFENAKTDVSDADKTRLIAALKNLNAYTDLENTLDTEEVLRYFVVHNFVVNGDSYTGSMIHNYYLYESDGRLSMIPWDYNLAFGTFQGGSADSSVNASIDSPVSGGSVDDRPMVGWIFSDESYTQRYHELLSEFLERWFSDGQLVQLIEETKAMLAPYVEKDPTRFCTEEEFDAGVRTLEQFVTLRAEAVSRQLEGDSSEVDCGDLNLSDMGSMNRAGGFDPGSSGGFPAGGPDPADPGDASRQDASESTVPDEAEPSASPDSPDLSPGGGSGGFPSGNRPDGGSFSGFSSGQPGGGPFPAQGNAQRTGGSAASAPVLLGVSLAVLLLGLVFAFRFRR